jgi:hypothetical protein
MIFLFYEKPHSFLNPLRGNSRAPFIIYPPESDRIYRNKGRGTAADVRRSASKLDLRYPWDIAPDIEHVDAQGERKRVSRGQGANEWRGQSRNGASPPKAWMFPNTRFAFPTRAASIAGAGGWYLGATFPLASFGEGS